jgi:prepilin-type N-terminal cleavage/methylation domain-containing protein
MHKRYMGFTLAEVLITLTIIGIIAAISIPALVNKIQKDQTVTQLKKAYTTLAQVVRLSEAQNGPNKDWDWGTVGNVTDSFNTYWKPYFKILKVCSTYSDCGYNAAQPWLLLNNNVNGLTVVLPDYRTSMILQDGTFISIVSFAATSGNPQIKQIYADINGPKPPNQYGKDLFMFQLEDQKGLIPFGYNSTSDCTKTTDGLTCAAKIIRDGWQIADDYPW